MGLLYLEGWEGLCPRWQNSQSETQTALQAYMNKTYGGRHLSSSSAFHLRRSQDGRGHCLASGIDGSGQDLSFSFRFPTLTAGETLYVGMRVKFQATDRFYQFIQLYGENNAVDPHGALQISTSRRLRVTRGTGTQLGITSSDAFVANTWYYLEFSYKVDNSTGTYEVKLDESSVLSGSGVDTNNNNSHGELGLIKFLFPQASSADASEVLMIDDIYVIDSSGSINTTYLGDSRVHHVKLAEVGSDSDFADYGSGNHTVNRLQEVPDDETSGITSINTTTNSELFSIQPFHTDNIIGVALSSKAEVTDGIEPVETKHRILSSASNDTNESYFVTDSDLRGFLSVHEADPSTSAAWTQTGLNAAEFGVEIG